jgi:hypothetical protein
MTFFSNTSITQVLFYVVNYQFDASFVYRLIEYSIDEHLVFFIQCHIVVLMTIRNHMCSLNVSIYFQHFTSNFCVYDF